MGINLRGYPITLKDTMFREESQHFLFCHNQLLSNTIIDVTLNLEIDGHEKIVDWGCKLGNPFIENDPLLETVHKHFISTQSARMSQKPYHHEGIFLIAPKPTALELRKAINGMFQGKILSLEQKPDWLKCTGRNKLEYLLQKCDLTKAEMAKISSYIRAESSQFQALIGLAHILPWYVSRINNNRAINQQLAKLPMWYWLTPNFIVEQIQLVSSHYG